MTAPQWTKKGDKWCFGIDCNDVAVVAPVDAAVKKFSADVLLYDNWTRCYFNRLSEAKRWCERVAAAVDVGV